MKNMNNRLKTITIRNNFHNFLEINILVSMNQYVKFKIIKIIFFYFTI